MSARLAPRENAIGSRSFIRNERLSPRMKISASGPVPVSTADTPRMASAAPEAILPEHPRRQCYRDKFRSPSAIAEARATRSAQVPRPRLAFSMFAPLYIAPDCPPARPPRRETSSTARRPASRPTAPRPAICGNGDAQVFRNRIRHVNPPCPQAAFKAQNRVDQADASSPNLPRCIAAPAAALPAPSRTAGKSRAGPRGSRAGSWPGCRCRPGLPEPRPMWTDRSTGQGRVRP
jgi:hypothetical protein